jgi:signal transduction histidine kinase
MPNTITQEPDLIAVLQAYNDVTERLKRSHDALAGEVCRLRDELHQKNKALERRQRLASLGQMAAGVAHEIRNPLGGIGLYASLLERDLSDRPGQLVFVRKMCVGIRNLEAIVSDILAFAGEVEPHRQATSLRGVIERAHCQVAPNAETRGVELSMVIPEPDLEAWCDAGQIERAAINLLLNAIDATGRGGRAWIRCESEAAAAEHCRIVVEDEGPGVPADLVHRIFDPFFTTKDTGTGLGLAIVHRIAEANGGFISAGERNGGGARFVLSVPAARKEETQP